MTGKQFGRFVFKILNESLKYASETRARVQINPHMLTQPAFGTIINNKRVQSNARKTSALLLMPWMYLYGRDIKGRKNLRKNSKRSVGRRKEEAIYWRNSLYSLYFSYDKERSQAERSKYAGALASRMSEQDSRYVRYVSLSS